MIDGNEYWVEDTIPGLHWSGCLICLLFTRQGARLSSTCPLKFVQTHHYLNEALVSSLFLVITSVENCKASSCHFRPGGIDNERDRGICSLHKGRYPLHLQSFARQPHLFPNLPPSLAQRECVCAVNTSAPLSSTESSATPFNSKHLVASATSRMNMVQYISIAYEQEELGEEHDLGWYVLVEMAFADRAFTDSPCSKCCRMRTVIMQVSRILASTDWRHEGC